MVSHRALYTARHGRVKPAWSPHEANELAGPWSSVASNELARAASKWQADGQRKIVYRVGRIGNRTPLHSPNNSLGHSSFRQFLRLRLDDDSQERLGHCWRSATCLCCRLPSHSGQWQPPGSLCYCSPRVNSRAKIQP